MKTEFNQTVFYEVCKELDEGYKEYITNGFSQAAAREGAVAYAYQLLSRITVGWLDNKMTEEYDNTKPGFQPYIVNEE